MHRCPHAGQPRIRPSPSHMRVMCWGDGFNASIGPNFRRQWRPFAALVRMYACAALQRLQHIFDPVT